MDTASYLKGKHVCLRAVEPEDLDFIYEVENDPAHWEATDFSVPYSRYMLRQYLQSTQCDIYADKQLRLLMVEADSGKPVGMADLTDYSPLHGRAEVGILVQKPWQGRGYAREALEMVCRYAFGFLHLHQLGAKVVADNEPSLRLFRACGFQTCGVLKEWWHVDGQFKDVVMMQKINCNM